MSIISYLMRGIILLFDADRHTGLEPELQKELADLDAFLHLLHQRLIKLRDGKKEKPPQGGYDNQ